ncbi:site-specific integrase [Bradyrhizobium sp. AUGA SZCCT0177]|uniref:site-specific integrase n=1 Tax=Bradyrhizobium sp. AUGA SZCCT0177 TaxID=2807665 RepID=UPI001BA5FB9B|nr:site-specific integrase [Bradyrhizobium sp. AUGA SZCCT0177]MBR1281587.1 site-specific integrase [Bradyrhizobium sp. AUGA SZCCT0177]
MGLMKDRHGTWYARVKVPERLQTAVARVLDQGKERQSFLKKSLGTKDLKTANVRAKPVLAGFDRTLSAATALAEPAPAARASLNATEIARMAEYVFAEQLALDERFRFGGRDEWKRLEAQVRRQLDEGEEMPTPAFLYDALPTYGLSVGQLDLRREYDAENLSGMRDALAQGDILAVEHHVTDALAAFGINLDPSSSSYAKLGIAVLQSYVRALQAIGQRNAGEPVETPKVTTGFPSAPDAGGTLRVAFEGWNKERERGKNSVGEYKRAVEMFIQLHGDLPIAALRKSHAREYREAIQGVPRRRTGALLKATLPELREWGRKHPELPKVSQGTINKQLGAVQTIAGWGHRNGVIPEDVPWSDPFHKMRVEEDGSDRTSFESSDLKLLFAAPVFTTHDFPEGGRGYAAFWLPLLALFNGARQAELAGLTVADVKTEPETQTPLLFVTKQTSRGKRLKTKASQRVIPVHSQLVKLGFLRYVEDVRRKAGDNAFLFPLVAPQHEWDRAGVSAWSKWFGRYLDAQGVTDTAKVFHSFRHGFKDALRKASPDEELRDALTGHRGPKSVGREYGAKEMLTRFGIKLLKDAVARVEYHGLDLSHVRPVGVRTTTAKRK